MLKTEPYAAPDVYDPPMYSQAVKVTGTGTIIFIAGQVAYGPEGGLPYTRAMREEACRGPR